MATDAQTATAIHDSLTLKIAEVLANPLPNITVDGVSIDRLGYYRFLLEAQKAAHELMLQAQGPYTVVSVAR